MKTVLVVEDDESICTMVSVILRCDGWKVFTAATIARAAELAPSCEPGVILLDYHLPDGDGLDAAKMFASQPTTREVPLILYSGSSPERLTEEAQALFKGYYSKLADPGGLDAVLLEHSLEV